MLVAPIEGKAQRVDIVGGGFVDAGRGDLWDSSRERHAVDRSTSTRLGHPAAVSSWCNFVRCDRLPVMAQNATQMGRCHNPYKWHGARGLEPQISTVLPPMGNKTTYGIAKGLSTIVIPVSRVEITGRKCRLLLFDGPVLDCADLSL